MSGIHGNACGAVALGLQKHETQHAQGAARTAALAALVVTEGAGSGGQSGSGQPLQLRATSPYPYRVAAAMKQASMQGQGH